jgi:hypothetical protein
VVDTWANFPIIVPRRFATHRFWRYTRVASQEAVQPESEEEDGQAGVVLLKGLIGHEFDEDIDNGCRPDGLVRLSHTPVDNVSAMLRTSVVSVVVLMCSVACLRVISQVVYLQDHSKVFDAGSVRAVAE